MGTHSHFFKKARHFLAVVVVLACCSQIVTVTGVLKQQQKDSKSQIFPKNAQIIQNATKRQDSVIFSLINKFLPDDWEPRFQQVRAPPNYLQIVLNASGVMGLGFLWIKEISAALGTPILAPILIPPLIILSACILLIPDLSRLGEILDRTLAAH